MLRGLFVTGTDTDVGKTTVAAAMMHRYRRANALRYWKPIQTGIESSDDTETVRKLGSCSAQELFTSGIRLPRPLSPHLSARLDGSEIRIDDLLRLTENTTHQGSWILEGAGGVMVPLNETEFMVDLMSRLGLPVVVVARSSLGTINHTLLSLESLWSRGLAIAGVVLVGPMNPENREAIEHYGQVKVVAEMPQFNPLTPEALGAWAEASMDSEDCLTGFLR